MRKLLFVAILAALASGKLAAQNTAVTGNVAGPNGFAWANATGHASLVCTGNAQAYIGSSPIPRDYPTVGLDSNGNFSQGLFDTSVLVDVNHNPLSCNYVYSFTDQCGIASFKSNPLTGVTGAGPVSLTSQIAATAVNLSAQCTPNATGFLSQTVASSATPVFSSQGDTLFNFTLTQNVTSSTFSTAAPLGRGRVFQINLCEGGAGHFSMTFPINVTLPTGYSVASTGCSPVAFRTIDAGVTWQGWQIGGTSGGGGNCSVSGSIGDVQKNNGLSNCAASSINDNNGTVNVANPTNINAQADFSGPNPTLDVTVSPYFARIVNANAIPGGNVTCTASSTTVAFTSGGTTFQNNDGIVIPGCGATQLMTTPSTPTVTPSVPTAPTGSGYTTAGAAGTTTIAYKIFGIDVGGGFSAPSAAGSTTTANSATLGGGTLTITAGTISNTTKTYTVSTSTANLAANDYIDIGGTGDDGEWGGWVQVTAVLNGTQFTVDTGVDSRAGLTTSTISTGTVYYDVLNHLVLPAPSDGHTQRYGILRSISGGAYCLVHIAIPVNLSGNTDTTYLTWDDLGTTRNPCLTNPPWWLPTTDGFAAQNDMLVTQITSGGGTSSIVVADAASNNNPGASISARFGSDKAIISAYTRASTFATGNGGTIYFPPAAEDASSDFCYVTSSFLDLASIGSGQMNIGGSPICEGDTIKFSGYIHGIHRDSLRETAPSFAVAAEPTINVQAARPGIWLVGSLVGMDNITIQTQGNDYLGVLYTPSGNGGGSLGPCFVNDANFSSDQTNADYVGILWETLGSPSSNGFGCTYTKTSWNTGPAQAQGNGSTPAFISKNNSSGTYFHCFFGSRRDFYFSNSGIVEMDGCSTYQGYIQPIVTATNTSAGRIFIKNVIPDTSGNPLYSSVVNGGYGGAASVVIEGGAAPSGPAVSGHVIPYLELRETVISGYQFLGQNVGVVNIHPATTNFPNGLSAPGFYLAPVITAPTPKTGAQFFDLYSDAWPSFVVNNNSTRNLVAALPSTTTWTAGQCYTASSTTWLASLSTCLLNPMTTLGDMLLESATPSAVRLPGPTTPNSVPQYLCDTPASGAAQLEAWCLGGVPINSSLGTSPYTMAATDRGSVLRSVPSSTFTINLVNPTTSGFGNNWVNVFKNDNGTANYTLAPPGAINLNGANSSLPLPPNWVGFLYSDNTQLFLNRFPDLTAFPTCTGGSALQFNGSIICTAIGGVTLQTNTVNNTSQTTLNLLNSAATNGLTLTVTNTSAGNVQLGYSGTLNNSGITNPSTTVNGTTCTLGASCSPLPDSVGTPSDVTGQSTSQSAVTLASSPAAGHYVINYYADMSAACPTGQNSVTFTFNWTDISGIARSLTTGNLTMGTSQLATSYMSGVAPIWVNGSTNVTYTSTVNGTCSSGSSTYDIHVTVERLR